MAKNEIHPTLKESVEHSKAEYVNLGKSGLRVSVPIFGAMSLGHPDWLPWVLEEEEVSWSDFGSLGLADVYTNAICSLSLSSRPPMTAV